MKHHSIRYIVFIILCCPSFLVSEGMLEKDLAFADDAKAVAAEICEIVLLDPSKVEQGKADEKNGERITSKEISETEDLISVNNILILPTSTEKYHSVPTYYETKSSWKDNLR